MARLDNPKRRSLSREDFEEHPVWTWDDENEGHLPLSEADPAPEEYPTLFIKARFEASGHQFDGYLIGGSSFYAFGLFIAEQKFVMNLNLPDLIEKNLPEIFRLLSCQPFKLFPLRFSSPIRFKDGRVIAGMLNL